MTNDEAEIYANERILDVLRSLEYKVMIDTGNKQRTVVSYGDITRQIDIARKKNFRISKEWKDYGRQFRADSPLSEMG